MTQTIRLRTSPTFLPERFRDREARIRIKFAPFAGERRALRKRRFVPPSVWAEKHRVVTYGPLAGALWDHSFMPHLRGIMDAFAWPSVREIGNCKAPQTGSSASMETLMGYVADMDPGPCLVVYPDKDTASKRSMDYLQDVFRLSPRLKGLLTGVDEDMARMRIKLQTMLLYLGWAGSATSIANVSVRYLWLDEIDKYPETPSAREANTVDLVLERVRAFRYNSKVFFNSTPTVESGPIWQFLQKANAIYDYYAKCPDCGHMQRMVFKNIRWPEDQRDPMIVKDQRLASYVCEECGSAWDDETRNEAVRLGEWRDRATGLELMAHLKAYSPERICFHTPSWISRLVSLSEAASAFLAGLKDKNKLKYFQTQHSAEPWVDVRREVSDEDNPIIRLKDDRPRGVVPSGVPIAALTAACDTQSIGYWYEIRAWGYGMSLDSWQIREGFVETDDALMQILFGDIYRDLSGAEYTVMLAVIDAMGKRTAQVYDLCRQYRHRLVPLKGEQRMSQPFTITNLEYYPDSKKPIPGGLQLYRIDTNYYKNLLASKLEVAQGDPGSWRMHSEMTLDWARQMTAEFVNEKGLWECPEGRANHGWDCSVYQLFAADRLGVKFWPLPVEAAQAAANAKRDYGRPMVRAGYMKR